MILESLRAGVAFLPRAWARPWFLAFIVVTALAGLAWTASARSASWIAPATLFAALAIPPLAQGPLYALAIGAVRGESTLLDGVARYVRLVAVSLLTAIFLLIPGLLLSVIGLGIAYGMAYAHPGFNPADAKTWTATGPVLVGGGSVVGLGVVAIVWLLSRVSLGPVESVAERRVLMLSTWPLTRGLGWRIAVVRLVVFGGASAVFWFVPVLGDVLLVGVVLPVDVGVLCYFHAHRSPLPVTP